MCLFFSILKSTSDLNMAPGIADIACREIFKVFLHYPPLWVDEGSVLLEHHHIGLDCRTEKKRCRVSKFVTSILALGMQALLSSVQLTLVKSL